MKNKYDDALREAFLKSAFKEAAALDLAELESKDIEIRYPSKKQKRDIERAIRKVEHTNSVGFGRISRAVAMIAIVCCLALGAIMLQPTVRASVWDVVVSFFEKYLSVDFDTDRQVAEYKLGEYVIGYIPDGYYLEETQENMLRIDMIFKNNLENAISVSLYDTSFSHTGADIENGKSRAVTVADSAGYLITYVDDKELQLVWGDSIKTFIIRGAISEKEIMRIAKSIK